MKILNHDYCRYPFPIQLSRNLADRGHEILHVFSASFQGPNSQIAKRDQDPKNLNILGLKLTRPFEKWTYWKRRKQEIEYGDLVAQQISRWQPQIVLSGNTPSEAQKKIVQTCWEKTIPFVFWVQDIYSVAVRKILSKKLPLIGLAVGQFYQMLERSLLKKSDAIILITEDFWPIMHRWGVDKNKIHVIHNWTPLDSVPLYPKMNSWSSKWGFASKLCLLYCGTLGTKHNPKLLLELARYFNHDEHVQIVVVSEGPGADWLRKKRNQHSLINLKVLPWQPPEQVPMMLSTADVLVAILETDAGVFSVPSKVLTYLCAQRPTLLAVPPDNLAAKIVRETHAGLVVAPYDVCGFLEAAGMLISSESMRKDMGKNARRYAESHFDINKITDRFETIFSQINYSVESPRAHYGAEMAV